MTESRSVDLFYLASNRLEFTHESFTALLRNTDWQYVRELVVNDNHSVDGTREWLEHAVRECPASHRYIKANHLSPVAAMNGFIESAQTPILAKVDNDTMLPPGWLGQSLAVLEKYPELVLLGIEAMYPHSDEEVVRSYSPADFISGLGLYRRHAFSRSRPQPIGRWFGLEEWQMARGPGLVRGWINPAICTFLLDRIPFEPWRSYSEKYIARGWQRRWPKYDPQCTLWKWHWPDNPRAALPGTAEGDPRFVCALRIKNEGEHIREVLTQALRLCRRAFVFDDHSTDDTVAISQSFGDAVTLFRSPFEGLDEARDKNFLLEKIAHHNPEWVLWIDGDEVLENTGPGRIRAAVAQAPRAAAWYLKVAYLWDDPQQVRIDGLFGNFRRLSLFRYRGQPSGRLRFRATGNGGNFHCGNVPDGLVGEHRDLDIRLKHYGYLTKEQRVRKYDFYTHIDPNNQLEDNYWHLLGVQGARHAPGPVRLMRWVE
jgi:glycosyltransferase involved in cell wall biosynthesis